MLEWGFEPEKLPLKYAPE